MTYAFVHEVPIDERMYREVREIIGGDDAPGLVAHVVEKCDRGLRYVDVWESEAAWKNFHDERVQPAVDKVLARHGRTPDPSQVRFQTIDVIDTWLGNGRVS
jgi:hypothetical protein